MSTHENPADEERQKGIEIVQEWMDHISRHTTADKLPDLDLDASHELVRYGKWELSKEAKSLQLVPNLTGIEYRVIKDNDPFVPGATVVGYSVCFMSRESTMASFEYTDKGHETAGNGLEIMPEEAFGYDKFDLEDFNMALERLKFLHHNGYLVRAGRV